MQGPSEEHVVMVGGDKNCNLQDVSARYDHTQNSHLTYITSVRIIKTTGLQRVVIFIQLYSKCIVF